MQCLKKMIAMTKVLTPKAVNEAIKGYPTQAAKDNRKAIFDALNIRGE